MAREGNGEVGPKSELLRTLVPSMPSADDLSPYLKRIDNAKWYSNFGPLSLELTTRLAEHLGMQRDNVCLLGNATLGLQAVSELIADESEPTMEIPSFTFAASAIAVAASKRKIRFIDVDDSFRSLPTENATFVMDVLPFGAKPRYEDWMRQLKFLIIDGAASFDALANFRASFPQHINYALVVSLHATKLIGAGEGGFVVSNNTELINNIKIWQNFGFNLDKLNSRSSVMLGTNAKMSEFSCAVGLASLDRWNRVKSGYQAIQKKALDISNKYGIGIHEAMKDRFVNPYWIIRPNTVEQTAAITRLCAENKLETRLWWERGCHLMPAFAHYPRTELPNTALIANTYLGLPFHLFLEEDYWTLMDQLLADALE